MAQLFQAPREHDEDEGEDRDGRARRVEQAEPDRDAGQDGAGRVHGAEVPHEVTAGAEAQTTSTSDGVAPSATAIQ